MMPVADFAGRFGWGYDAVDLYAPTRLYGSPDEEEQVWTIHHLPEDAETLEVAEIRTAWK